VLPGILFVFLI